MKDFNTRASASDSHSNDNDIHTKRRLARQKLAERLKASTAYGVPYKIIRPTEFEELSGKDVREEARKRMQAQLQRMPEHMRESLDLSSEELTRRGLWSRPYDKLSKVEQEFLENKAEVLAKNDPMPTLNPADFKMGKTKRWARDIYSVIQRSRMQSNGLIDMAVMPPRPEEMVFGSFAHQAGREQYKDKNGGLVVFHPGRGEPTTVLRQTMNLSLEGLRDMGISRDEFELMILEHELSHLSGAGEPQADSMAAIQVMRTTKSDQMARYMADFRMLSTMRSALTKRIADKLAEGIAQESKKYEAELETLKAKVKDAAKADDAISPQKLQEKQLELRKKAMDLQKKVQELNSKALRKEITREEHKKEMLKLQKREEALQKEGMEFQRKAQMAMFNAPRVEGLSPQEQRRMMMLQQQVGMMDQHSAIILQQAAAVQQAITMYGIACVDALDAQVKAGVQAAMDMTEDEIRDMRFTKYNHDPMAVSYLVDVMGDEGKLKKGKFNAEIFAAQQNIMGIHALAREQDMKSLGDFAKTLTDENDVRLTKVPAEYRKEVVRIAKRFAQACDNMLVPGLTPDEEKKLKAGAGKPDGDRSQDRSSRRGPGPVMVRRRLPF